MTTNDGGPAFPHDPRIERRVAEDISEVLGYGTSGGMSLRDYFAAHAVAEPDLVRMDEAAAAFGIAPQGDDSVWERIRVHAAIVAYGRYAIADAMLAERAKAVR